VNNPALVESVHSSGSFDKRLSPCRLPAVASAQAAQSEPHRDRWALPSGTAHMPARVPFPSRSLGIQAARNSILNRLPLLNPGPGAMMCPIGLTTAHGLSH